MLREKIRLKQIVIQLSLLCAITLQGCVPSQANAAPPDLRIIGALDVLPIIQGVQKDFSQSNGMSLEIQPSTSSIKDLKAGRADIAILGREPSPAELVGLEDHVIAYDAVCMITNTRVYSGGLQMAFDNVGTLVQPASKYEGLRNLSLDELRGHISNLLRKSKTPWHLRGTNAGYYTFQVYLDDNGLSEEDSDHPGQVLGTWVWNDVALYSEALPPGRFDTEEALFQKLGFQDTDLANPQISFIANNLDSEELLISHRYKIKPDLEKTVSDLPFEFWLDIVSLRITKKAIQHGFEVRALSINGVNPTSDPKVIYDGAYPLSRKIHFITRQPASPHDAALLQYLLSPAGQQLIAQADYLPLPPGQ
ncbi:MAG: hypothetical protein P4L50_29515 [Anaerolineaceae bacterium]|nr:hypothetical protein [Anaerolineaceae bacterium]